ncbi:hypothetical protein C8R43DRAFT_951784 [Mycena crocata]|nr:hypothetical protein C8R43DRAFT_951784 [Mycena crocata]
MTRLGRALSPCIPVHRYKLGHLAPVPASHFSPHFLPHIDSLSECGNIRTARSSPSPALQSPPTPPRLRLTFDAAAADITPIWMWFPRPLFFIKPPPAPPHPHGFRSIFAFSSPGPAARARNEFPRLNLTDFGVKSTCGATQVLYSHIQAQALVPMPKILMAFSLPIWSLVIQVCWKDSLIHIQVRKMASTSGCTQHSSHLNHTISAQVRMPKLWAIDLRFKFELYLRFNTTYQLKQERSLWNSSTPSKTTVHVHPLRHPSIIPSTSDTKPTALCLNFARRSGISAHRRNLDYTTYRGPDMPSTFAFLICIPTSFQRLFFPEKPAGGQRGAILARRRFRLPWAVGFHVLARRRYQLYNLLQ